MRHLAAVWIGRGLRAVALLVPICGGVITPAKAASVTLVGQPRILFDPAHDGCDGNDVPDAPARAFRRADGNLVLFGLHYTNHPLIGPGLDSLRISCRSAFEGHGTADPSAYDDRSWMAATWTRDGVGVDGLVHHEFQANEHPGRCRFPGYMQCWFNTVLAVRSTDGGATFVKSSQPVVASAPFKQDVDQGRHRGFFNPSNIVSDGRDMFMMASTTGWAGQEGGVCLFRTHDPDVPGSWRAFDGRGFSSQFGNPYAAKPSARPSCATVAPFPAPVGSLVRQRTTGDWLSVFQAKADAGLYPVSGFYTATSSDLTHWSAPQLLMVGTTNYDDPCRAGSQMIAYPSLIDPEARGRNFDDVGYSADLLFASLRVDHCRITADRVLMVQRVRIEKLSKGSPHPGRP